MLFPEYAKKALSMLCGATEKSEAYFVGGCVRDALMNRTFDDIDITTNLLPDEIVELFCIYKTLDIGKKHGTITVFIEENSPLEITTYRQDGTYSDNRHPNKVTFTPLLLEDLKRRDFTINALCSQGDNDIIDLFGGCEDIKNKLIRAIGKPEERFCEDALRILRAFRFMSQLNFKIESSTAAAAQKCSSLLLHISMERITAELSKLLLGENPTDALLLMKKLSVLPNMFDIQKEPLISCNNIITNIKAVELSPKSLEIRAAILLTDVGISSLKLTLKQKHIIKLLRNNRDTPLPLSKVEVKRLLRTVTLDEFHLLLRFKECFGFDIQTVLAMADEILSTGECYCLDLLKIKGNDLKTLGFCGKKIGEMLSKLLSLVIEEQLENEPEALLEYAKRLCKI